MISTQIGKMKHRVTWQQATETTNNGKISTSYSTIGDFWAEVIPMGGTEAAVNTKVQASMMYRVTMRNIGAIKPKDKLVYGSINLQIESVVNTNSSGRELILTCKEII